MPRTGIRPTMVLPAPPMASRRSPSRAAVMDRNSNVLANTCAWNQVVPSMRGVPRDRAEAVRDGAQEGRIPAVGDAGQHPPAQPDIDARPAPPRPGHRWWPGPTPPRTAAAAPRAAAGMAVARGQAGTAARIAGSGRHRRGPARPGSSRSSGCPRTPGSGCSPSRPATPGPATRSGRRSRIGGGCSGQYTTIATRANARPIQPGPIRPSQPSRRPPGACAWPSE